MTVLDVHIYVHQKIQSCVCVTVKIQFDNTSQIVLMSIHHNHPLLGRYALSHVCPPPHSEILDPPMHL